MSDELIAAIARVQAAQDALNAVIREHMELMLRESGCGKRRQSAQWELDRSKDALFTAIDIANHKKHEPVIA